MLKTINGGKLPTRGSEYSAFVDLYANTDVVIGAGETKIIGLGVCVDMTELNNIARYYSIDNMPQEVGDYKQYLINHIDFFKKSHYLQLEPRSSLRAKGLIADTGIIDLDYEDEIGIIIHNPISNIDIFDDVILGADRKTNYTIKKGDRIAQISLMEHKSYLMGISSDKVRDGGYGSTDNED